ncbi:MAG: undecaprenyl-phosphate glycosyltransferase, DPM1-like family [Geobacteraceae bacterium]|nr:undecaprenyl-phosphate glycosyltransferase, DPM1-like family [Geobacteraceae bacterium]
MSSNLWRFQISIVKSRTHSWKKISFVIPVFNEEENIPSLFQEIKRVADTLGHLYEVLFVNDCSTDNSLAVIRELAGRYDMVRCFSFPTNRGKSAALGAGFQDGDYDMVNGWRYQRRDTLSKRIGSRVGNYVRNRLTGETIHDTGCSLKIMRADMLKRIKMFRGLHRFLPTLMRMEGARVVEVKVGHRPRIHGVSKYTNYRRAIEGFYDLLSVRWMLRRYVDIRVEKV